MKIVIGILKELAGLFVEDLGYSILIGFWIALGAVGLPQVPLDPRWRGPVLFLGIVVILCENVTRSARKNKRSAQSDSAAPEFTARD
ncbi:MAG: hypothetical protein JWQ62_1563 [Lacunisphaera sp.]|jgi:hypothetical protein|nr:hypothetical protein [Lacunisphaera sp.]